MPTLRECQYLEYIRKKDMNIYGEVVRKLKEDRLDQLYHADNPFYDNNAPWAQWVCGVVVSMFDFHCSDRGSNPGRGGEFS